MKQEVEKLIKEIEKDLSEIATEGIRKIGKIDSKLEVTFEGLQITEMRCEECGSENVEDLVWDDEDDPNKEDVCLECQDCNHITTLRTVET